MLLNEVKLVSVELFLAVRSVLSVIQRQGIRADPHRRLQPSGSAPECVVCQSGQSEQEREPPFVEGVIRRRHWMLLPIRTA
jgi:hypothetical protein